MSKPIIALIDENNIEGVSELLNNNGFESRYTLFNTEQFLHLDEEQFIRYYNDFGYDINLLNEVLNEINKGKIGLVVHYDYDDLPGIYEILNSFGYSTIDTLQADGPIFNSYNIYQDEKNEADEDCISINIPAHFIDDPSMDQETFDNL